MNIYLNLMGQYIILVQLHLRSMTCIIVALSIIYADDSPIYILSSCLPIKIQAYIHDHLVDISTLKNIHSH